MVARPLIPLTLSLALGVASSAWAPKLPPLWLAAAAAVLFLTLLLSFLTVFSARLVPLVLFGVLGLAVAQQALHPVFPPQHVASLPQGETITLKGCLYFPSQVRDGRVRLFLEAEQWLSPQGWRRAAGRVLLTGGLITPLPKEGDRLVVRTVLRRPRDLLNPGAFPCFRYWASRGLYRVGRLKAATDLVILAREAPSSVRERLREGCRRLLAPLPPVPRALYLALILGDQGEITPELRQAFSRTGTSHLLAISGLHLGMVTALSFWAAFWLLRRFPRLLLRLNAVKAAAVLAAGPMLGYAWVSGGSTSTQRAEIMILAYLVLVLSGRPREVPSALALAAFLILAASPLLLFTLSFQLSFVAVAALCYFLPRWLPGLALGGLGGTTGVLVGQMVPEGAPLGLGGRLGLASGYPGHRPLGGCQFSCGIPFGRGGEFGGHSPDQCSGRAPGAAGPGPGGRASHPAGALGRGSWADAPEPGLCDHRPQCRPAGGGDDFSHPHLAAAGPLLCLSGFAVPIPA
ncbi:MAG: ComEC/Rec2 family competence protein, partial [Deltaproteobacteria bacterium]|nr:ComEC/Rec2 family competence protein [Deltaproteobacteria bacterium]